MATAMAMAEQVTRGAPGPLLGPEHNYKQTKKGPAEHNAATDRPRGAEGKKRTADW